MTDKFYWLRTIHVPTGLVVYRQKYKSLSVLRDKMTAVQTNPEYVCRIEESDEDGSCEDECLKETGNREP